MEIKEIIKKTIGWIICIVIALIALFHKYDYERIYSVELPLGTTSTAGQMCLEGTYADGRLKIEGTVTEGSIKCYYFHSEDQSQWDEPEDLIVVERTYEAGDEADEEIKIGTLNREWQYVGMEQIGEEQVEQDITIVLEARQYGYQIVEEFFRTRIPWLEED